MNAIETLYKQTFDEKLISYKQYSAEPKVNKQAYALIFIFAVVLTFYLLALFNVIEETFITLPLVIVLGIVAFILPIIYILKKKGQSVVITDRALIYSPNNKIWKIIPYDTIRTVKTDHQKVVSFSDKTKDTYTLYYEAFNDDFIKFDEILTYLGHFDHDAREFTVDFTNDLITVEPHKLVMDEETTSLYDQYHKAYTFLTPGFNEDVIIYNSQIQSLDLLDNKHLVFKLAKLDIKPSHPENTSFKAQKTGEAIIIFEYTSKFFITINNKSIHKKDTLANCEDILQDLTDKAVIFEASIKENANDYSITLTLSHDAKTDSITFSFKQLIAGWNAFEANSWFEE